MSKNVVLYAQWKGSSFTFGAVGINKTYDAENSKITLSGTLETDEITYYIDAAEITNEFKDVTNATVRIEVTRNRVTVEAFALVDIEPASLTITTGSAAQPYNGKELTKNDVKVDGLQGDEELSIRVTGTITQVGSAEIPMR